MENVKLKKDGMFLFLISPISKLKSIILLFVLLGQVFTGSAQIRVEKNINYAGNTDVKNMLNIYHKKGDAQNQDVIVFIHGGSWSSGEKETYWWLGRNLARKNMVAAIINYPLAPNATYKEMALASAKAVKWVQDSIANFGGNPNRIFVMGHSAGGHLAELINADPQYFNTLGIANPIKGVILDDAFGLDMDEYLTKADKDERYTDFLRTFTTDQKEWQAGSPLFYISNVNNPHLIFYGTKTYEAIQIQSKRLNKELESLNVPVTLQIIEGKKHVPMISQMIFGSNKLYDSISTFMQKTK